MKSVQNLAANGQAAFARLQAINHELEAIQRVVFSRGPQFKGEWDALVEERGRLEQALFALAAHKWEPKANERRHAKAARRSEKHKNGCAPGRR